MNIRLAPSPTAPTRAPQVIRLVIYWTVCLSVVTATRPVIAAKSRCTGTVGSAAAIATVLATVDRACPCDSAKNEHTYRACIAAIVKRAASDGTLPSQCKRTARETLAVSTCGREGAVTCCYGTPGETARCRVKRSSRQCRSHSARVAALGSTASCTNACLPAFSTASVPEPSVDAAVATAIAGLADPWGADLGLAFVRAAAELHLRLDMPTSSNVQTRNSSAADATIHYCGVGNSVTDPSWFHPPVSTDLDGDCATHDECYLDGCVAGGCWFTPQSHGTGCDDALHTRCEADLVDGSTLWDLTTCILIGDLIAAEPVRPMCAIPPCGVGQVCEPTTHVCVNCASCSSDLTVSVTARPGHGSAPLHVDLVIAAAGSADAPVDLTVYCDRCDNGMDVTLPHDFQILKVPWSGTGGTVTNSGQALQWGGNADRFLITNACTYSQPGSHCAKVIAAQGNDRTTQSHAEAILVGLPAGESTGCCLGASYSDGLWSLATPTTCGYEVTYFTDVWGTYFANGCEHSGGAWTPGACAAPSCSQVIGCCHAPGNLRIQVASFGSVTDTSTLQTLCVDSSPSAQFETARCTGGL